MFQGHNIAPPRYNQSPTKVRKKGQVILVSDTLWCDVDDPETNVIGQIGHSFSSKDPKRRHYEQTIPVQVPTGNSYGQTTYQERQEVTEVLDMCGYHWEKTNPFQPPKEEKIQALERENADWQKGYEAGEAHRLYVESHAE